MGTHARLTDGTNSAYVHYDGMPDHMLPELRSILATSGPGAIDLLLAHDWSGINSEADHTFVGVGKVVLSIGMHYLRPKMSNESVRNNAGQHVYLLDRATNTVTYI